ncbi:8378_t:CDS:2 [Entrophospora sp. SA101]|nr:8378_t:CDS:2 [Entrophospora sp. SA101]
MNLELIKIRFCPECSQRINSNWCEYCEPIQFKENFDNWTSEDTEIDRFIQGTQLSAKNCTDYLEWIPFESFIGIDKYDEAETGIVYAANWKKGPKDSWDEIERKFIRKRDLTKVALISYGNNAYAFLKESITGNYMMVAETVEWDVRHYTSHHFSHLTWSRKLGILYSIASTIESFQNDDQMMVCKGTHGNGQIYKSHIEIPTNELGLGTSKEPIPVIGKTNSKSLLKSIIHSNLRPTISENNSYMMPECYIDLMKKCWSSDPKLRPTFRELVSVLENWHLYKKDSEAFEKSEKIRIKILKHKGYDTTPDKLVEPTKVHPQAIYASRKLKFPILHKSLPGHSNAAAGGEENHQQPKTIDLESLLIRDQSYFSIMVK